MSEHDWTAPGSARPEPDRPWPAQPGPPPGSPPQAQPAPPSPAPGASPYPGTPQQPYPPAGYPSPGGPAAPFPGYPPTGGPAYPGQGPGRWQPGYVPVVELRPGIIPLRPLALGDIFGAVMKTIRGNVAATIGLAFVTTLILMVPSTALGVWVNTLADPLSGSSDPYGSSSAVNVGPLGSMIPTLVVSFGSIILTGFIAYVVGQGVLGRKVSAGETWEGTRGRLLPVIGASLLTGLIEVAVVTAIIAIPIVLLVTADSGGGSIAPAVLLMILAVVAAIGAMAFLWTRFAFPTAAIVLERVGVIEGIRRSWRLTSGTPFWRVLGIRMLTGILVYVASEILTVPITLVAYGGALFTGNEGHLFVVQAVISGLTGLIIGAITTPFTAGVDAVLYVDQRIRREGLDVRLIAAAQAGGPPPWPAARQG